MARSCNTYSTTLGTVNQSNNTQTVALRRYAGSTGGWDDHFDHWARVKQSSPPSSDEDNREASETTDWRTYNKSGLACDDTWYWQAHAKYWDDAGETTLNFEKFGVIRSFQTWASDPTVDDDPTISDLTSSSFLVSPAAVNEFTPATLDTAVTLYVQYKKTSDSTWTTWGTSGYSSATGYVALNIAATSITGLDAETSYDVRYFLDRTGTANTTTAYYSGTSTVNTLADTPSVTTNAATSIGFTSATLNATVDHNTVDGNLSWRYILTASYVAPPDDAQGTELAYSGNPVTADLTVGEQASGLTSNTAYTFWAIYDPTGAGDTIFGDADTFTTQVDPGVQAAESEMLPIQTFKRKWNVATTIFFVVPQDAGSSSDLFYSGAVLWAGAGESAMTGIVYDDDATPTITALADTTSDPARVASTNLFRLDLTAAEMQHDEVYITLTNSATSVRDIMLKVVTHEMFSTIDLDASNKATNTTALTCTGNGTGAGASFVGGDNDGKDIDGVMGDHVQNYGTVAAYNSSTSLDLDNSTAVGTNDYYNGGIFLATGGTGAGQARVITDYVGATYAVTFNKALATAMSTDTTYIIIPGPDMWQISPGAELGSLPTFTSNFADFIQFLFQRFAYKRTQTATTFTMFEEDEAASFASNAVDDDGTTQTHEEMGDL